jgi:hypothetical protein
MKAGHRFRSGSRRDRPRSRRDSRLRNTIVPAASPPAPSRCSGRALAKNKDGVRLRGKRLCAISLRGNGERPVRPVPSPVPPGASQKGESKSVENHREKKKPGSRVFGSRAGRLRNLVLQGRGVARRHAEAASRASVGVGSAHPLRRQFVKGRETVIHLGALKHRFGGWEF